MPSFQDRIIGLLHRCQLTCDEAKRMTARPERDKHRPEALVLVNTAKQHLQEAEVWLRRSIREDKP